MEQNKVLMIIVSVAIFFAAIVGVGVALLYPRSEDVTAVADTNTGREFDPIEYVRRPERAPLEETTEDEPVIIVYGDRSDGTGDDGNDTNEAGSARDSGVTVSPDRTSGESTDSAVAERTAAQDDDETAASAASQESGVARSEPSSDAESGTAQTGTEETPRSLQEPRPEPRRVRVTEYWIQLIASPNRDRVEQVRGMLADYSLGGRVTTRDVDGELYYRLRVGPYDNHDEAEKFLTWIRDIDAFQGAYISEEYPLRTVNG